MISTTELTMINISDVAELKCAAKKILSKFTSPSEGEVVSTNDREEVKALNDILNLPDEFEVPKSHSALVTISQHQSSFVDGNANTVKNATTLLFGFGFLSLFSLSKILAESGLSEQDKSAALIAPSITATLARFYLGFKTGENGGNGVGRALLYTCLLSLMIGTTLYGASDMTKAEKLSDRKAIMLLFALFLSGSGLGTISLVSNAIFWFPKNLAGYISAFIGGYGGMFPGFYLGLFYIFNMALGDDPGQITALSFLTFLLAIGISTFGLKKGMRAENAPNFQLQEKYDLTLEEAEVFAKILGQESFPSASSDSFLKNLSSQFIQPKIQILIVNYIISFGLFLGMSAALLLAMAAWGHKAAFATLAAAVFSANSSLWRGVVGLVLDRDPLGGGVTNSIGMLLVCIGAASIVTDPESAEDPNKIIIKLIILGGGLGLSCAAILKIVSQLAITDKRINVPTANGLIAGLGPVGANIYTVGAPSLAARYPSNPGQGYIDIMYYIIGLACASGGLTLGLTMYNKLISNQETKGNKKYQGVLFTNEEPKDNGASHAGNNSPQENAELGLDLVLRSGEDEDRITQAL